MNWNFFKTNWFYFALGLLLLLYAARKYPHLNPLKGTAKNPQIEKTTEDKRTAQKGVSLLGIVQDTPRAAAWETGDIDPAKAEAFLKRFAKVAVSERKKFGIPASVILACAYTNSQAGQSGSAREANNFFALACGEGWEAETMQLDGKCVRKYETPWESYRDFSIHLSSQDWFGSLKKSAKNDWQKWIETLGKQGVSNSKTMKKVIELYKLYELDGV
jgi:flagellum-specific peptidoglycan hydrolase FlgJ